MKITDSAYMARMSAAQMQPALTMLEAAMLPAKMPKRMGALTHAKQEEARRWRFEVRDAKGGAYRQKIWVR